MSTLKKNQLSSEMVRVLTTLPGYLAWKDTHSVYQGCNNPMAQLLGLSTAEEIIGKTDRDLPWSVVADTLQAHDKSILETGLEKSQEVCFISRNDQAGTYLNIQNPLRDNHKNIIGIICALVDITYLKQNEFEQINKHKLINLYLENILANLPEPIYWTNKEGVMEGCNEAEARIFGCASAKPLLGKTIIDIGEMLGWEKQVGIKLHENILEVIHSGVAKTLEEVDYSPSGEKRVFLSHKSPLYGEDRAIMGMIATSINITNRKKQEIELKEAKERAEAADHLKANFIHNMEHDMRTPFWGVIGMADILAEKETDPEKKEYAKMLKDCAQQLFNYCNTIIDFSKIEAGAYPLLEKKFNIRELIQRIVKLETPAAEVKKLIFTEEIANNIPDILVGDPNRLERLLLDLTGNAIKFTKEGFVKITVRLAKKENDKRAILCFYVEDTGVGISKDLQPIIYEKFVRGTPSNKEQYKGFGLGLWVAKQLIKEMEGEIEVKSEEGKGTMFICTIPFLLPIIEVDPLSNEPVRILLIETDQTIQKQQTDTLKNLNCEVDIAASGVQTMELFTKNRYDIIFMCVTLPDIDGITLLRTLREKSKLPIIILANRDEQSAQGVMLQAGANSFVAKPFERDCQKYLAKYIVRFALTHAKK